MTKTKIVVSVGDETSLKEQMIQLIEAGANTFRFNFSHVKEEDRPARAQSLADLNEIDPGHTVGRLADLQGPKIRLGDIEPTEITEGETVTLTTEETPSEGTIPVAYEGLNEKVNPGERLFVDDGKIALEVESIDGQKIICKSVTNGTLKPRKGLNLPDTDLGDACLTEKDLEDLDFICTQDFDYIALSFVESAENLATLRAEIAKRTDRTFKIVSKVERPKAIKNIDEIIENSDAIMIARGDLAIEVPYYEVPKLQKMMIEKCQAAGIPAITATQMLDSMESNPHPTRAEVTDIFYATQLGTDATMLSGETTVGDFPVLAVQTMRQISDYTEKENKKQSDEVIEIEVTDGSEAIELSKTRPEAQIIAKTNDPEVASRLALYWGVQVDFQG